VRQSGKHRTADRLAEKAGERRVFVLVVLAVRLFLRVSALACCRSGEGGFGRNAPNRLLLTRQRQPPGGASGLGGVPTPDAHHSYSITLLPHPSQPGSQSVCGGAAKDRKSAARSVRRGRNDRRGRPPVRRTLAPPFGLVTGPFLPIMRGRRPASCAPRQRGACCIALMRYTSRHAPGCGNGVFEHRFSTTNPFPLESPGALGYSPLSSFSHSLRSPIYAARRFFTTRRRL
jgi:hypothetical protein